jgi:hypothetical protein
MRVTHRSLATRILVSRRGRIVKVVFRQSFFTDGGWGTQRNFIRHAAGVVLALRHESAWEFHSNSLTADAVILYLAETTPERFTWSMASSRVGASTMSCVFPNG